MDDEYASSHDHPAADPAGADPLPPTAPPAPSTWPEQVAAFLAWLGEVSAYTRRTYLSDLRHFARWYGEAYGKPVRAEALAPIVTVMYKAALTGRLRLKPATVKRRLSTLRRFGQWALARGLLDALPTAGVHVPPAPQEQPPSLTPAAANRLLQAARADTHKLALRNYAMLRLLLDTGLRVGELVNLRLGDLVDGLDQPDMLTVAERTLSLPPEAQQALRAYLQTRPTATVDHVFLSTRQRGLTTEAVRQMINKYARRAGLNPREVSPHLLRHTHAKRLLDGGASLPEVQANLGHARRSSTAIYARPGDAAPDALP